MGLSVAASHRAGLHEGCPRRKCRACADAQRPETTTAVTPARDQAVTLRRASEGQTRASNVPARLIIPQLDTIARGLSADQLARTRWEVVDGDRVAVYRRRSETGRPNEMKIVITGPDRLLTAPPKVLEGEWFRVGVIEFTEDGERVLPEEAP